MSRRDTREQNDDAVLAAYRAAACAEADAHFDDRALETQRHKILARLAHLGHPAKVIRFPKAAYGDVPASRVNRRWISVAAAAGLLIGLLGGQLVNLMPQQTRRLAPMATSNAPSGPARSNFVPASATIDDSLLNEIDLAVQLRGPSELRALTELTLDDPQ
ncbi:MAG TPA: hypothetical protein VJ691_19990 [Vicinamibacterales bacterium]|nr:hypothetical protein [Vicinamibacterales bacterium]